jgi:hypothetical protein
MKNPRYGSAVLRAPHSIVSIAPHDRWCPCRYDGVKFPETRRTGDALASRFFKKVSKKGLAFLKVRPSCLCLYARVCVHGPLVSHERVLGAECFAALCHCVCVCAERRVDGPGHKTQQSRVREPPVLRGPQGGLWR